MSANIGGGISGAASGAKIGSMIMPGIGTAAGAVIGGIAGLFGGGKEKKGPTYVDAGFDKNFKDFSNQYSTGFDPQEQQRLAIAGNAESFDSTEELLKRINQYKFDEQSSYLEKAIPGYGALRNRMSSLARESLNNPYELPEEIQTNLKKLAAERGVKRGTSGQFDEFSLINNFGIENLSYAQQRINQGTQLYNNLYNTAPHINPASPMGMMITPQQQSSYAQANITQNNMRTRSMQNQFNYEQSERNRMANLDRDRKMGIMSGQASIYNQQQDANTKSTANAISSLGDLAGMYQSGDFNLGDLFGGNNQASLGIPSGGVGSAANIPGTFNLPGIIG